MEQDEILDYLLYKSRVKLSTIEKPIKHLKWRYNSQNLGSYINYDSKANRLAYLYLFVSAHSKAVEKSFYTFLSHYNWFPDNPVSIISFGGGPGSEHIGLIKAIKRCYPEIQKVKCTNADIDIGWKYEFEKLLKCFDNHLNLTLYFKQCDLSRPMHASFWKSIVDADIVTIVKFLSSFAGEYDVKRNILNNICVHMKPGALLFYLDGRGGKENNSLISDVATSNRLSSKYSINLDFSNDPPSTNQYLFSVDPPNTLYLIVHIWSKSIEEFDGRINDQSGCDLTTPTPNVIKAEDLGIHDSLFYSVEEYERKIERETDLRIQDSQFYSEEGDEREIEREIDLGIQDSQFYSVEGNEREIERKTDLRIQDSQFYSVEGDEREIERKTDLGIQDSQFYSVEGDEREIEREPDLGIKDSQFYSVEVDEREIERETDESESHREKGNKIYYLVLTGFTLGFMYIVLHDRLSNLFLSLSYKKRSNGFWDFKLSNFLSSLSNKKKSYSFWEFKFF